MSKVLVPAIEKVAKDPAVAPAESISILVTNTDVSGEPQKVLTGDTLFIGDVGRPDLVGSKGFTAEEMAGMLYDSIHQKLLSLPDDVEIYPAHGAGSACGRNISSGGWRCLQRPRKRSVHPRSPACFR